MEVAVRPATVADAASVVMLRARALAEDGTPAADGAAFATSFATWMHEHRDSHLGFLAEFEGDVVGMAWLLVAERVPSLDRPYRRFGDVQSVYVLPELRNARIGAALLAALLAEAGVLGLEHVTVHASTRAVPFYERAGFRQHRQWLRWEPE